MFNLIVNILAVLLMIGVAIAGLTYLGPAFTNAQTKATFAAMLNAGEQFQGAEALYKADNGGNYGLIGDLSPTYLSATPVVPSAFVSGTGWLVVIDSANSTATATLDLSGAGTKAATAVAVCALVPTGAPFNCDVPAAPTKFSFSL